MYSYALGGNNSTLYLLPGGNQPFLTGKRHQKYYLSEINISLKDIRIGRKMWKASMNDYTKKHGPIGNIGKISNHSRTTIEPNLNSYFNELMRFPENLQLEW